jgi:hypothetical protein
MTSTETLARIQFEVKYFSHINIDVIQELIKLFNLNGKKFCDFNIVFRGLLLKVLL